MGMRLLTTSANKTFAEMAPTAKKAAGKTGRSAIADVVAREYTIHLHKRVC
jgi:large subunit ribosomal protein L31e